MHLDTAVPAVGSAAGRSDGPRSGDARTARHDGSSGSATGVRVLVGLAAIILLAALGWRLLGGAEPNTPGDERSAAAAVESDQETSSPPDPAAVEADVVEITALLVTTLERISDEASARAALPDIKELHSRVGQLHKRIGTLPAADRRSLAPVVASALAPVHPLSRQVLGTPGSGAIVEPVLVPLLESLDGLDFPSW